MPKNLIRHSPRSRPPAPPGSSCYWISTQFGEVGGLNALKRWLEQRKRAFLEPDPALDAPKGILLVGVQGGGKSLAAKAVAELAQTRPLSVVMAERLRELREWVRDRTVSAN